MSKKDLLFKIGQLMVVGFGGKTVTPEVKKLIHEYHVGSIILFARNIGKPQEVLALTTELQREAKKAGHLHPLLICVDQENGAVRRLGEGGTIFPGAMTLGATHDPNHAYTIASLTGGELKALGINWNLAPVVDVNNNPNNPVIGIRSFGESAEKVSQFGEKFIKGMQDAGVITTLKHFPGHGDTDVDSHLDLPVISHQMERLEEIELRPFKDCIEKGADVVMTAHIYFPAIETEENVPATLSKKILTGLLREKLGFNGVVTTDCMEMNAIANGIGTAQGGVEAVKAGADLVMVSHTFSRQQATIEKLVEAVETGYIEESTVDAACSRVIKLKEDYLRWEDIPFNHEMDVPEAVGSVEHGRKALEVYQQGITIVKNENGLLPLNADTRVLVVYPENNSGMQVEDKRYLSFSLGESVREVHPSVDVFTLSNPINDEDIEEVAEKAKDYDAVIVGTLTVSSGDSQVKLVEALSQAGCKVVVIATRSPYDLSYLPDIPAYLCTYEFTPPALKTACAAIFGKGKAEGTLPVTLQER